MKKSPIRILHLEDEEVHTMLAETTLRRSGIDCEMVPVDTHAGFEAALEQGDLDLILCDHRLSEFD
ncbi:MAG: response regulator, partial [Armatimonadetes bacterium]|nr:response regulator [Armatimonadota bacterium]